MAFRVLAAGYHPDHCAIAKFRKQHLFHLEVVFIEVLLLAEDMSLVKLGHVSLDCSKMQSKASKHKAMSYGRMDQRIGELKAEVDELFSKAKATDKEENKKYGKGTRGDELPEVIRFREQRIGRIEQAKAALEAEEHGLNVKQALTDQKDDDPPNDTGGMLKSPVRDRMPRSSIISPTRRVGS